ncbi:MAG: site-specific integrase [Bacteroidales bacterium]
MEATDFSKYLTGFLTNYLPHERGASTNTISSYRYTFVLFIRFMEQKRNIKVNKLAIKDIKQQTIVEFLNWLQSDRKNSNATRNLRLAAIHSFFKYIQYFAPDNLYEYQSILSVKVKKKEKTAINYLTLDGIRLLLEQPDRTTLRGRRDLALLSLMYDTGARVQEIIDLIPSALHLDKPTTIRITGKGNKTRIIPLLEDQVIILKSYLSENDLTKPFAGSYPLFFNNRREKLTRAGVTYILEKYADKARQTDQSLIPDKISCHIIRHSKAMHLLQAGVNLIYIRDILGHISVETTEIYARADSKQKREAIEKAYVDVVNNEEPIWQDNKNLLNWLMSL